MPLPVPNLDDPADLLLDCASVRMFADRALCVMPDFELGPKNARHVAAVCCALDGLPLAIDLVASRVDVISPAEMARQLEHGAVPAGEVRDKSRRDRTVTATIDWSYSLLNDGQRRFLRRLCVFRGGCDAEAAARLSGASSDDAVDMLRQLRARSLVAVQEMEGTTRYRILEVIRRCMWNKLGEAERVDVQASHAAWCLQVAEDGARHVRGPDQIPWLRRISLERDNLRAALEWLGRDRGRREEQLRLATALFVPWSISRHYSEGAGFLTRALETYPANRKTSVRAGALYAAGYLTNRCEGSAAAAPLVTESLAIREELGDEAGVAECCALLGHLAWSSGDVASAEAHLVRSMEIARRLGDTIGAATALNALGLLRPPAEAKALYEESLAHWRRAGDQIGEVSPLWNLACLAEQVGDYPSARSLLEQGLELARSLDPRVGGDGHLYKLAFLDWADGDLESARRRAEEALAIRSEGGPRTGVAATVCLLAFIAADSGETDRAIRFFRESLGVGVEDNKFWLVCHCVVGIARIALSAGDADRAAALCAAADHIWKNSTELVFDTYLDRVREQTLDRCRAHMGEKAYERRRELGRGMSLRQAAECAMEFRLAPAAGAALGLPNVPDRRRPRRMRSHRIVATKRTTPPAA